MTINLYESTICSVGEKKSSLPQNQQTIFLLQIHYIFIISAVDDK